MTVLLEYLDFYYTNIVSYPSPFMLNAISSLSMAFMMMIMMMMVGMSNN